MIITMKLISDLGEFESESMSVTDEQYVKLTEMSSTFYNNGGYEMHIPNGFLVVPPEIVKKSILIIQIK